MKYITYGVAVLVLLIAVTAMSFTPKPMTETEFLLDTYVSVTVYGNHKEASKKALDKVEQIHKDFSAFLEKNEVDAINHAGGAPVSVSEECFHLLSYAVELSHVTDGVFDITVKPVMDLWDFGGTPKVPEEDKLQEAISYVDYREIVLDETNCTVTLKNPNAKIDLGGIAKGYAADCAIQILQEEGVTSACLDFGGNVVTLGERPLGLFERIKTGKKTKPFAVGIQSPTESRGTVAQTVTATTSPFAVVTSGGYERNFTEDGMVYHHIIDPKTGKQPQNGILSVTVVAQESTVADALSTALFVTGESGVERVSGLYEEIIFILDNGEVRKFTKE